jgi:hypothetical protein
VKGNLIYRIKSKSVGISCAIIIGLAALFWVPSPVEGMGLPLVIIPLLPIHLQKSPNLIQLPFILANSKKALLPKLILKTVELLIRSSKR